MQSYLHHFKIAATINSNIFINKSIKFLTYIFLRRFWCIRKQQFNVIYSCIILWRIAFRLPNSIKVLNNNNNSYFLFLFNNYLNYLDNWRDQEILNGFPVWLLAIVLNV